MAKVYVGTYGKYNAGSIAGAWLDLEDYSDKDEFHAACAALHSDEADPEYMFQDHEDIPDGMISESHIDAEVWEWLALDEDDREMVKVYRDEEDSSASIEYIQEAYQGTANTESEFAQQLFDDLGYLGDENPLVNYVDWDAVVRDLKMDYSFVRSSDGTLYVFRPH